MFLNDEVSVTATQDLAQLTCEVMVRDSGTSR